MFEARQGGLKAALSDVTPGAHDVRPDLNLHTNRNFAGRRVVPPRASCARAVCGRTLAAAGTVLATGSADLTDRGRLPATHAPAAHPVGVRVLACGLRRPVAADHHDGRNDRQG